MDKQDPRAVAAKSEERRQVLERLPHHDDCHLLSDCEGGGGCKLACTCGKDAATSEEQPAQTSPEEFKLAFNAAEHIRKVARALAMEEAARLVQKVCSTPHTAIPLMIRALAPLPSTLVAVDKKEFDRLKSELQAVSEVLSGGGPIPERLDEYAVELHQEVSRLDTKADFYLNSSVRAQAEIERLDAAVANGQRELASQAKKWRERKKRDNKRHMQWQAVKLMLNDLREQNVQLRSRNSELVEELEAVEAEVANVVCDLILEATETSPGRWEVKNDPRPKQQ